jgi:hypothetical protein
MIGWVVLSKTWVQLTEDTLRRRLDELYPGEFLPPRKTGTFVVEGPVAGAQFLIKSAVAGAAGIFMLHSVPGSYSDFSGFAAHIKNKRLRSVVARQEAWLSVELIGQVASRDDAYRFIGKVLAALAPADAAILVHPSRMASMPFDDDVRRRLANGDQFD